MYYKNVNSVATANSCGAMETGDHSKNGASPKSQMSRGNLLMSAKGVDFKLFIMKRLLLVSAVIIGFGVSLNAQDFCDETGNRIEFYPEDYDGKVSFFNGGDVQVEVEGNFLVGKYKTKKSSSTAHLIIEFYDKEDKYTPAFFGKYYRGKTSREGKVLTDAYIEILGVKLKKCKKKK
jgi:hypothetical protein